MKNTIIFFIIIIFTFSITYFINGCGDDPIKPVTNTDPGILRTDEFGNELGGDITDWCTHNSGGFQFGAAYPNPTTIGVNLRFYVPDYDTVILYFLKTQTDTTKFFNMAVMPGSYTIHITDSTRQYKNTYQRAYIKSKRYSPGAGCSFYGDIKFEE